MSDLISRQDAIDKIKDWMKLIGYSHGERNVMECTIQMLEDLPSVEPVIIRCKDCKFSHEDTWMGKMLCERYTDSHETDKDGFCSKGKRRT